MATGSIPIVDVGPLRSGGAERTGAAAQIRRACREHGFFYVRNHDVDAALIARLERCSREFFRRDLDTKLTLGMERGGRAWRGYFPLGAELTSGKPDRKEGLYFGAELAATDPRVRAGIPLHGRNLFPDDMPEFRHAVLAYLDALTALGHTLMTGIALSLRLEPDYFASRYTGDPLVLFRIFHYPAQPREAAEWGVGEHTDYGLLTILHQDEHGGLEVRTPSGWIEAAPVPNTFVCNIGDMLDRMTGGSYRSTPHRVLNRSGRDRLSLPFFFDPSFDAEIRPIDPAGGRPDDRESRWDRASVHAFEGTYGDYLMKKVSRVFPELFGDVLDG